MAELKKSTSTVVVGCKMPGGLILRVCEAHQETEPVLGGGYREVTRWRSTEDRVVIKGNAVAFGKAPRHAIVLDADGQDPGAPFTDGYALTTGVDRAFWEKWLEQNKDSMVVKNRIVFAVDSVTEAEAIARAHIKVRSGLEPGVEGDSRAPRGVTKADVAKVA